MTREEIILRLQDAASDLLNNTEKYLGDTNLLSYLSLSFDNILDSSMAPTISVSKEYIPEKFIERHTK